MAINFPHDPNPNDVHTEASLGRSWKWDGTTWKIYSSTTTGIAFGDLSVSQQAASGSGSLTYNNAGIFTYTPPAGGGGGGSSTFIGLNDTPNSLSAGKWLKVNTGGTALEWTDAPAGNDTNDYVSSASLSGNTLTLGRTGSQALANITVDLSSLNNVPTTITVADESTEIVCYPLFTTTATGNLEPKTGTNIKFNSSSGQLEAGSFKKTGGTAAEFLKADGSIDSTTYLSSVALNDLSDVTTGTISDGDVLKYSGTNSRWEAQADATGGGGATTLGALTDVDVTGAANGKILKYNGTSWEIADDLTGGGGSANFTGLSDTPNSLTAGKWLKVNAGATALEWTDAPSDNNTTYDLAAAADSGNAKITLSGSDSTNDDVTLSAGGGITYAVTGNNIQIISANSLGGLTDVTISGSPSNGQVLKYNGSAWVNGTDSSGGGADGNDYVTNLSLSGTTLTAEFSNTSLNQTIDLASINTDTDTNTQLSPEQVQDIVGGMFSSNTETRITATYQDSDGTIDLVVDDQSSDNNTTYDLAAGSSSGNATIALSGSDSSTDTVTLSAGGGIVYNVVGNDIAITSKNNLIDLDDTNYSGTPSDNDILKWSSSGGVGGSGAWILGSQSPSTNNYANSLSFNTGTGVLTLGMSGLSNLTVDLDGRYATGTIPTNNNQLTNGAGYITSAPTNNNQLTNGAGYITSSGTAATATNANNVKIRTDDDAAWHYLTFVDSSTDNQNQTLKIDSSGAKYYPSLNWLQTATLQSAYMSDWNGGAGNAGDVLTSQGANSQWAWVAAAAGFLGKTKITILTSGTGNHTTESWCKTCWAIILGGGGGAGSAFGGTAVGGNGGHGGMQINYQNDLTAATSIPYSVGAGGARQANGNCDDDIASGNSGGSSYFGPTANRGTAAGGGGGAGAWTNAIGADGADGGMRFFASDYGAGGKGGTQWGGDGCQNYGTDGSAGAIFILELG